VIKIADEFKLSIFTLEQILEDMKNKPSIETKQDNSEKNFIKIYNSMQKYVHTPEQRKKAKQILKKYNQILVYKDDVDFPKGYVHKAPLHLTGFFKNLGKPIKINYK